MKKILFLIPMLCILSTCTKKPIPDPICKSVFRAVAASANVVAAVLDCKNPAAIAGDLADPMLKIGLCSENQIQSTLSDFLCPQIAALVTTTVATAIPQTWECTVTTINDIIKVKITESCGKLLK